MSERVIVDRGPCALLHPVACLLGGTGQRQAKPASLPRRVCVLLSPARRRLEVMGPVVPDPAQPGETGYAVSMECLAGPADALPGVSAAQRTVAAVMPRQVTSVVAA